MWSLKIPWWLGLSLTPLILLVHMLLFIRMMHPIKINLFTVVRGTLSKLFASKSKTVKRKVLLWDTQYLPLEIWLGRGQPLPCNLKFHFIHIMRAKRRLEE